MRVRLAHSASTASHRAFVTCARPSHRVRRAELITDLPDGASGIFLREGMDRLLSDLPVALLCRTRAPRSRLQAKRSNSQRRRQAGPLVRRSLNRAGCAGPGPSGRHHRADGRVSRSCPALQPFRLCRRLATDRGPTRVRRRFAMLRLGRQVRRATDAAWLAGPPCAGLRLSCDYGEL